MAGAPRTADEKADRRPYYTGVGSAIRLISYEIDLRRTPVLARPVIARRPPPQTTGSKGSMAFSWGGAGRTPAVKESPTRAEGRVAQVRVPHGVPIRLIHGHEAPRCDTIRAPSKGHQRGCPIHRLG